MSTPIRYWRSLYTFVAIVFAAVTIEATAAPGRWDLADEYPDDAAWEAAVALVHTRLERLRHETAAPFTTPERLAETLESVRWLQRHAAHLARHATLSSMLDESDAAAAARTRSATELEAEVSATTGWVESAVAALDAGRLRAWRQRDARLQALAWPIEHALAAAPHLARAGSEAALAYVRLAAHSPVETFEALARTSAFTGTATLRDGSTFEVAPDNTRKYFSDARAEVREAAHRAYTARMRQMAEPLGVLLSQRLAANVHLARLQNFDDPVEAFFVLGDGLQGAVVARLLDEAPRMDAALAGYAASLKITHGIERAGIHDLDLRAPSAGRQIGYDAAVDEIAASWRPAGPQFQQRIARLAQQPWIDWEPRPHKQQVGVFWGLGIAHPYAVLSFSGDEAGERSLAQVLPLMLLYANLPELKAAQTRDGDYPVFGNAVWFLGQMVLDDHRLKISSDRDERQAIRHENARRIWNLFARTGVYLQLERELYGRIRANAPLDGPAIAARHAALARERFGAMAGVDDDYGYGALPEAIGYDGEVLAEWALAMAAAADMAERMQAGDARVAAVLMAPLKPPRSFSSSDLLRDAGTDLSSPAPYAALRRRLQAMVDGLVAENAARAAE